MDQKLMWRSHIEYARQKARATRAKVYHDKQDIEAGTSEQSDAHQVSSSSRFIKSPHGKDQAESSKDIPKSGKQRKSVTARVSELQPGARSTPRTTPIPAIG